MNNNNEILGIEKTPSLTILKEDISNPFFEISFELNIKKILENKTDILLTSDLIKKSKQKKSEILDKLQELDINLELLEKIEIKESGEVFVDYIVEGEQKQIVFDLLDEINFYKWNKAEIKEKKEKNSKNIIKILEKSDKVLDSMDYIFTKNEKEWFWEINNLDALMTNKFWRDLNWMNLKHLKSKVDTYFKEIDSVKLKDLPESLKKDILKQKSRYLEMTMWVWDKYEWAAKYLELEKISFNNIVNTLIDNYTTKEILIYLKELHKKIDDNNYQSTTVERSYEILSSKFHEKILEKLKKEEASDLDFVNYAKILTGRWDFEWNNTFSDDFEDSSIDDYLRDQQRANEALLYMMNRKDWVIEKVRKSWKIKIENKELENKNPNNVVNELKDIFYEKFWENLKITGKFESILKWSWYADILNLSVKNYSELNYEQQTKISVLHKVSEKLKSWKTFLEKVWQLDITDNENYVLEEFAKVFNDVARDYMEEMYSSNETFSKDTLFWKNAKQSGLTWVEAEAFDLFQEINGNWLLDLSDTSIERLKMWWKFVWVIAVAITVPLIILPTMWIVAQGAAAWAAASLASMAISPHWYDTLEEARVDISSDIAVWTFTWLAGWALAKSFWVEGAKLFSEAWRRNAYIFAWDLIFLWLVPEALRMMAIDEVYHGQDILTNHIIDK